MPGDLKFPIPFAGITEVWGFDRREDLVAGLLRLSQCHMHNFAVEMDAPGGIGRIWSSEVGSDCLGEDQELRRHQRQNGDDPYEHIQRIIYNVLREWFEEHTATRRRDMPNNIAIDLRRELQRQGLMLCHASAPTNAVICEGCSSGDKHSWHWFPGCTCAAQGGKDHSDHCDLRGRVLVADDSLLRA